MKILRNRRGQALVITAISVLALLAMAGLAADGGFYLEARRRAQTAADAAAMAGAIEIWRGTGAMTSSATTAAAQNGFDPGSNVTGNCLLIPTISTTPGVSLQVCNPPQSGPYLGNAKFVEAIVRQQMSTLLLGAVGYSTITPAARAVAGPENSPVCIQTLSPNGTKDTPPGGLSVSGGKPLNLNACGIVVNSNSTDPADPAISTTGGSTVTATSISEVGTTSCLCTPAPQTGALPAPDPFAGLQFPLPSPPPVCPGTAAANSCPTGHLSPGVYYGGINTSGTCVLDSGNYILYGGGFTTRAGANVSGTNVSFYNTGDASGKCLYGGFSIMGGAVNLSAPTTGSMAGMLFFQDKNNTANARVAAAGANFVVNGALYFPSAGITFSAGGTTSATCLELVAQSVSFSGGFTFNTDCPGYPEGAALISSIAMAE